MDAMRKYPCIRASEAKPNYTHLINRGLTYFVLFPDHPGFHYSPDGDKKDSPLTKDGPTPRRGRRKGEKLKTFSWEA